MPAVLAGALNHSCSGELGEALEVKMKVTDQQGVADLDPPVIVVNRNRPLANIVVYQVAGEDDSYLIEVIDPSTNPINKHFPERVEAGNLASISGFKKSGLIAEIVITLETVIALDYARRDVKRQESFFTGAEANVDKYCIPLQQLAESNISVPLGIIGVASEEIQLAAEKPLSWIFHNYVIKTYGRHEAYEVWVPRTVTNLCGKSYTGVTCPITTPELSERLWRHHNIPAWEIKGPCQLNSHYQNNSPKRISRRGG